MKILLTFSLLLSFLSCSDFKKDDRLIKLNSTATSMDELEERLAECKVENMESILNSFENMSTTIKRLDGDTIPLDLAKELDKFKQVSARLDWFEREGDFLKESIMSQKEQVANLIRAVENGAGKRDQYDEDIQFEEEKLEELTGRLEDYTAFCELAIEMNEKVEGQLGDRINERIQRIEVQLLQ